MVAPEAQGIDLFKIAGRSIERTYVNLWEQHRSEKQRIVHAETVDRKRRQNRPFRFAVYTSRFYFEFYFPLSFSYSEVSSFTQL